MLHVYKQISHINNVHLMCKLTVYETLIKSVLVIRYPPLYMEVHGRGGA